MERYEIRDILGGIYGYSGSLKDALEVALAINGRVYDTKEFEVIA